MNSKKVAHEKSHKHCKNKNLQSIYKLQRKAAQKYIFFTIPQTLFVSLANFFFALISCAHHLSFLPSSCSNQMFYSKNVQRPATLQDHFTPKIKKKKEKEKASFFNLVLVGVGNGGVHFLLVKCEC